MTNYSRERRLTYVASGAAALMLALACLSGSAAEQLQAPQTPPESPQPSPETKVLVTVNGESITQGDLDFLYVSRRVPQNLRAEVEHRYLNQLIDAHLMRAFLADRKATAQPADLDAQVKQICERIAQGGDDPAKVLAKLGYDDEKLKQQLALPLAWQIHVGRMVTAAQLREYWDQHRQEFDGTEVTASHILLKVAEMAPPAEWEAATSRLNELQAAIESGETTFAEAARQHSHAASAREGGRLGSFPYRGKMPIVFSQAAFPLEVGEISKPFRTPFGMHLLTVTGRRPGQFSLEDVRAIVYQSLAGELWDRLVEQQRSQAKIEWPAAP